MRHRMAALAAYAGVHTTFEDVEAEVDEEEDGDMGFGLFDDASGKETPPHSTSNSPTFTNTASGQQESASPTKRQKVDKESGTLLQRLIARQSFSGSWTALSEQLCADMNIKSEYATAEPTLLTVIVVVFFERKMRDQEETWELVVEKARGWVEEKLEEDGVRDDMWRMAGKIVG
jgi:hypothetical protein